MEENYKELFVPYELAIKLKKKGFDEPCIAYYFHEEFKKVEIFYLYRNSKISDNFGIKDKYLATAPLYQQVLDWLDKKEIYLQPILIGQLEPECGWGYELTYKSKTDIFNTDEDEKCLTRNKAIEAGIQKIIKQKLI